MSDSAPPDADAVVESIGRDRARQLLPELDTVVRLDDDEHGRYLRVQHRSASSTIYFRDDDKEIWFVPKNDNSLSKY